MKATALFLVICMVFVSVFAVKAKGSSMFEKCCHKTTKSQSCEHQQKDDCGQGMCNTMLSCNTCGFLFVEQVTVKPIVPVLKERSVTPYLSGSLSAYSSSSWRPPKV
ncbi:hypothetical protein [Mucilaginibacter sp. OK268]|uniref:hypothetical protein n=1 Tax=Mucilaginibacter sp. OK268 TaxID=1881048 RepID=UPI0011600960|nr:hypothetical protein [Mucilaginibacter sp. OK268]